MIRNLKDYRWEYGHNRILAVSKQEKESILLTKVAFMSLMRFGISCLDKMRTDRIKLDREKTLKLQARNQKTKERIQALKLKIAKLKGGNQQSLFSKKDLPEEHGHDDGEPQEAV